MSPDQIRTAKIIAAVIGIAIMSTVVVIEIVLGLEPKPDNTFSNILRGWAIAGLAAPFGWGTLAGHFFHPVDDLRSVFYPAVGDTPNLLIAVSPIVVLAIIDVIVAVETRSFVYPTWVAAISLAVGCVWGALVWPVRVVD